MEFGALSLIPPMVVIVLAIWTKRSIEPLIAGCLVGFLMINPTTFFSQFVESLSKTLQDEDMVWVILVCGFYGALIGLLIASGGANAFGRSILERVRTRRGALVATWGLGVFMFLDDYMSALTTGATMRRVTDHHKISRGMLAFLVNTTAAPLCCIVPISTWTIYAGKLIEKEGLVADGQGFWGFLYTIPFVFYAWVVVILALFVALGWFPVFGKLAKMEADAAKNPSILQKNEPISPKKANSFDFLIPLIVLLAATIWFEIDALKGVIVALVFTAIFYKFSGKMRYSDVFDHAFEGFKSMLLALGILTMSYVLKLVGDKMGLTPFVVESIRSAVSGPFLPVVVFLALAFISYTTASSWGMYAIAIPLIAPVAASLGANVWLTIGAVISAGAFGSHACMYSDATILTAASCETDNVEHSLSQLPYAMIAVTAAAILYFIFGFLM
jgi:tetracycline resistance efflux pump